MIRSWLKWVIITLLAGMAPIARADIAFGIVADLPRAAMQERFGPLVDYLAERLDEPVHAQYLTLAEADAAVAGHRIDLLMTNPAHFIFIKHQNALSSVLATRVQAAGGTAVSTSGGVIIVPAAREEIRTLKDLRGRTIAIPGLRDLGGFQAQAYELHEAGVDISRDATLVRMEGNLAVVRAVTEGRAEAGFIPAGTLEQLIGRGELAPGRVRVLNAQALPGYPYQVSTRLYSDWPIIALPTLSWQQQRAVAGALMALPENHPAAQAAGLAGFIPANDYTAIEALTRELRLPPFETPEALTWRDIRNQYGSELSEVGALVLLMLIVLLLLALVLYRSFRFNRRILEAQQRLQLMAEVFEHAGEGILITDLDGRVLEVNRAFSRLTGYSPEEIIGNTPALLQSGRQDKAFYAAMWTQLRTRGSWQGEIWNRRKDGGIYPEYLRISSICNERGEPERFLAIFSDITELKQKERMLERQAHYDALTGLPNRTLLRDRLEQAMAMSQRKKIRVAVGMLDLDGFKPVNDRYGHDVGDQLLVRLAQRLSSQLRETDTLARLGGDEFAFVLQDVDDSLSSVLERLLLEAAMPIQIGDIRVQVTASIGCTLYPQQYPLGADQLMRQADQAMYRAKHRGKNRFQLHDAQQDQNMRAQQRLVQEVEQGLEAGQFELYYQPQVDMATGALVGAEVLLRWHHPEQGLLTPGAFLPHIEMLPLMHRLDTWVLEQAVAQQLRWQAPGISVPLSINISGYTIEHTDFVGQLKALVQRFPELKPQQLMLEVLESRALSDMEHASRTMAESRALGFCWALDDFGTGYASLNYLKRLPAQMLKIDQSFVRDMEQDPEDMAIVEAVVGLGQALRRQVLAEGVETEAQGQLLLYLGCRLAQGYGVARPMPAQQFADWLPSWQLPEVWRNVQPLLLHQRSVLHALVAHRAWLQQLCGYLHGEHQQLPELDGSRCQLAEVLAVWCKGQCAETDRLHKQIHQQAQALVRQHQQGQPLGDSDYHQLEQLSQQLCTVLSEGLKGGGEFLGSRYRRASVMRDDPHKADFADR